MEIFDKEGPVRICAPMVRYSKLAFRNLVRLYDVDVAFSPMILADSFYQSQAARDNELTTNSADKPPPPRTQRPSSKATAATPESARQRPMGAHAR